MSRSEAENRAIKKYEKEKIDRFLIRIPKGEKERIAEHARAQGESANAFIYRAVNETIARDEQKRILPKKELPDP